MPNAFVAGPSRQVIAPAVTDIRGRAAELGSHAPSILIFALPTEITRRTDAEAQAKFEECRGHISHERALTLMSGWTGIVFSQFAPDDPVRHTRNDAIQSAIYALTVNDPDRIWTVREFVEKPAIGGLGARVVGSPEKVVDEMKRWIEATGVDGFNLAYALTPASFEDFVELVVPELQARGLYVSDYAPGALGERLFGAGARLAPPHPADAYRTWRQAA